MLYLRSFIFLIWFLTVSIVLHIVALPVLVLPWRAAVFMARTWSRSVLWGLKVFCNLRYEVRGNVDAARQPVLVACKHHSMWETMAFMVIFDEPAIVMKSTLFKIPFYGWFSTRAQMISVDRAERASALKKMVAAAKRALAIGRPIVIFPEGTRKDPDEAPDYKPGVAGLYGALGVPCIPVALNSGVYWTPGGFIKRPGTIVIEFLAAIPPGLRGREFMASLQTKIEEASNHLVAEGRAKLGG